MERLGELAGSGSIVGCSGSKRRRAAAESRWRSGSLPREGEPGGAERRERVTAPVVGALVVITMAAATAPSRL